MKPELASASSDAIARTRHPRLDYRTEEARRYTSRLRPFLESVLCPGQEVLDLGCGAGKFTFELEQLGAKAVGVDCSQEAIALARKIAVEKNSSAEFQLGSFGELPFPDNRFDAVLFPQNIIECSYEEMDSIAFQLQSILRKRGRFYVEMRDELDRVRKNTEWAERYNRITGQDQGEIRIPNEGAYPYETTFWTVAFARFVICRYLDFVALDTIDNRRYMLTFEKH